MSFKEFGGYFPLELPKGIEYYRQNDNYNVNSFDCGRSAIAATAICLNLDKLYIPYYNCETVRDTLLFNGVKIEYYFLDDDLQPKVDFLGNNEWLLYVNYFGNTCNDRLERIADRYKRVIFDNTQGFFSNPVLEKNTYNIYSPRKFFGVSDGAYVIWKGKDIFFKNYKEDVSWRRSAFLLKSLEVGTNEAYVDNLKSMNSFGEEIRQMSKLTHRILSSIDYDLVKLRRTENANILHDVLYNINEFTMPINCTNNLMIYPLLVKRKGIREKLVRNHIYVPQWWKYLLPIVPPGSVEAVLSEYLLPLPIDQRYSANDMLEIANVVFDSVLN